MKNRGVSEMPGGGGGVGRTAVVTAASVKTVLRKILKDTLQYGMFLGSFSGGYVALEEGIALGLGRERTRGWRALVAGFVAGGSLVLAGGDKRHTSLALYMALKGLTFLVRCGNVPLVIGSEPRDVHGGSGNCGDVRGKDGVQKPSSNNETERKKTRRAWVRRLLAPTRFSQGDVLLMCLAMSQLGFSWIVEPSTLPGSMLKFLNKHGGQSARTMDEIRVMCTTDRNPLVVSGGPDLTARLSPSMRPSQEVRTGGGIPCDVVHPGQTCNEHAFGFFPQAYARAIPVYLPVYIIPALLIHRQRLLSDPEIWPKIVKGTLRSSLFLSLFCTLAWKSVCTAFKWHGRASGAIVASSCWVAGLALLAEKKSRRMELSIYAMSRALESFGHCLVAWGYLPQRTPRTRSSWKLQPRTDVILFSMAAAAICHCYSDHDGQRRDVFGGKYLNFFDFMFGNTGFDNKGRIRHVPTNRDLVALAGERMRRITKSIGNDLASLSMTSSVEDESDDDDVWTESSSSDDDELL